MIITYVNLHVHYDIMHKVVIVINVHSHVKPVQHQ